MQGPNENFSFNMNSKVKEKQKNSSLSTDPSFIHSHTQYTVYTPSLCFMGTHC